MEIMTDEISTRQSSDYLRMEGAVFISAEGLAFSFFAVVVAMLLLGSSKSGAKARVRYTVADLPDNVRG